MTDRIRFFAPSDLHRRLQSMLPGATETDFAALTIMIRADKFLKDDGMPHPAFVNWVAGILDRDAGDPVPVPVMPVPKTGPAGASIGVPA